jgi:hypothetical protein
MEHSCETLFTIILFINIFWVPLLGHHLCLLVGKTTTIAIDSDLE